MGSLGKAKLLAGMAILMLVLWLWQLRSGDAGTVNVGWSAGIGILALVYALTSSGSTDRRLLLAILAGGWSFRLAGYLFLDRVRGAKEDGRYRELRQSWENRAQTFFLIFFQAQALLALLFSLPLLVVAHDKRFLLQTTDLAALILFVGSVLGESIADRQLARFRSQPGNDGKTCRQGPWRYSRHPNYFFEWLHWWTYVLMGWGGSLRVDYASGTGSDAFFLFKVTGIPPTEQRALATRGDDYRRYQQTTSVFFPWFPRRESSS